MSFPSHVDVTRLRRDPGGRGNHVWYPPTDEVFHVDEETFASILTADPLPVTAQTDVTPQKTVPVDLAGMKFAQLKKLAQDRGLTVPVGISTVELVLLIEQDMTKEQQTQTRTRDEMLTMAADLGLDIVDGASDEEIEAAVLLAVQSA